MRAPATVLAEIRRASLTLSPIGQRPGFRSVDEHPRWIWPVLKPILSRDLAGAYGLDDLFAVFDGEIERLDVWLDHLRVSGRLQPRATVHGDFNPRNLIFDGGRLVAVIDWDECHADSIAWEVAQVGFGAPEVDPVAFWDAYLESGGPLTSRDCAHLGGFARVGTLTELQRTTTGGQATPTPSSSYAMSWRLFLDFTNAKHPS